MKQAMFALLMTLAIPFPSMAQDDPTSSWVPLAETSEFVYSGRKSSFELAQNKAGTEIASILVQSKDLRDSKVLFWRWYVTTADCDRGFGQLVMLDLDGRYLGEKDFISDGASAGSMAADVICRIYRLNAEALSKKGL